MDDDDFDDPKDAFKTPKKMVKVEAEDRWNRTRERLR